MDRRTIYNNKVYSLGFDGNKINLYSLDKSTYPDILALEKGTVKNAFKAKIWVIIKGCHTLYAGRNEGKIVLNVRPSEDVDILNAKEIEKGLYQTEVSVSEIQKIWEERVPYQEFPFPEGIDRTKDLTINDLL